MSNISKTNLEWVKFELELPDGNNTPDILPLVDTFIVTENIYSYMIEGVLTFLDHDSVFSKIPFVGGEKINTEFKSLYSNYTFSLTFEVISGTYVTGSGDTASVVTLNVIEDGAINLAQEYSTAFTDKLPSEWVKEFSEDILKKELSLVDSSKTPLSITFPYMRFDQMISYINQYDENIKGYKNYLYFTTLFTNNYTTLSNLMEQEHVETFTQVRKGREEADPSLFSEFQMNDTFDTYGSLINNEFGTELQRFDPDTKKVVTEEFTYKSVLSKEVATGKYSMYREDIADLSRNVYYASTESHKPYNNIVDGLYDNAIDISIYFTRGIVDRKSGDIVKIIFKDWSIDDQDNDNNNNLTGFYMIKGIIHGFTKEGIFQTINVIKIGNEEQVNDKLIQITNRGASAISQVQVS